MNTLLVVEVNDSMVLSMSGTEHKSVQKAKEKKTVQFSEDIEVY